MRESTITKRGQTTIPKEVREALKLSAGDRIRYVLLPDGEVHLRKIGSVLEARGALASKCKRPYSLEEIEAALAGRLPE